MGNDLDGPVILDCPTRQALRFRGVFRVGQKDQDRPSQGKWRHWNTVAWNRTH
jgi:hypothetical protein